MVSSECSSFLVMLVSPVFSKVGGTFCQRTVGDKNMAGLLVAFGNAERFDKIRFLKCLE